MSQSRKQSLIESFANIAIGFSVNYSANLLVLPLFGYTPTLSQNFKLGVIYTVISLARSYVIRRVYNRRENSDS